MLSLLHGGGVGSKRCCQIFELLFTDLEIRYMHNERLFCLLSIKKLAPEVLDLKLCYSKFSPVVMVLGSRQSQLCKEDLNFQLGRPIPDKKIITLIYTRE